MTWHCLHFSELSTEQLHDVIALRIAVFVVEQNCPYPELDGKDKSCYHILGTDEKGIVQAYSRIVPPGMSYEEPSIGRVCCSQDIRGSGSGKELMLRTLGYLRKLYGNIPVRISAQTYLEKFYTDLGFVFTGKAYLEDNIPHIEMLSSAVSAKLR